jgi:hypothetical protein
VRRLSRMVKPFVYWPFFQRLDRYAAHNRY